MSGFQLRKQGNMFMELRKYIEHIYILFKQENDIALIKLIAPLPFNDIIAPICLAEAESDIPYGRKAIVTGWGAPGSGANPTTSLMEVALDVITVEECALLTPLPPDHSKLVCTLSPFKDACQVSS
ncbi:hypothetical protein SK128_014996 [Halocaridina rubra]|uniref:Peptidase S1 domain-containing protein n=1 Tax=Halocaridina rubra TaxID=373956 RepID=A0AAN9A4N3_HALRR